MVNNITNQYYPDFVSPPGETILELLEESSMSQAELAIRMGRPEKTISNIINGKTTITSDTALQLEKVLGVSTGFWLNRQRFYDEYLAKERDKQRLGDLEDWVDSFPIRTMEEFGWIRKEDSKVEQANELLKFFGVASPIEFENINNKALAAFRLATTFESDTHDIAVWLRKGETKAQDIYCNPYDKSGFLRLLKTDIRSLTLESPKTYQHKLPLLCSSVGVAVVFVPQLPKARVSGATRWLSSKKAIIQLSLRYKTDDQLWFTFFHEAGHIILHGKTDIYLEIDKNKSLDPKGKEEEVNNFAADIMIPPEEYNSFVQSLPKDHYPSKEQIIKFAHKIGIAPSIVVGRLQHDQLPKENPIPYSHYHELKSHLDWIKK